MQRYSVENAFWWAKNHAPFLEAHQLDVTEPLRFVDKYFKQTLEEGYTSENILAIAVKQEH